MIKKDKCVGILYYRISSGSYEIGVHNGVLKNDVYEDTVAKVRHVANPNMKIETLYFYKTLSEYDKSNKSRKYVRIKIEETPGSSSKPGIAFLSNSDPIHPHNGKFIKFVKTDGKSITDFNSVKKLSANDLYTGTLYYKHWDFVYIGSGKYDMILEDNDKATLILKIKEL